VRRKPLLAALLALIWSMAPALAQPVPLGQDQSGSGGGGTTYTAAANSGLTLTGTAFSLGDGQGISYNYTSSSGQLSLLGASSKLSIANCGAAATPSLTIGGVQTGIYCASTTGFGISVNGTREADFGQSVSGNWTFQNYVYIPTGGLVFGSSTANPFLAGLGTTVLNFYAGGVLTHALTSTSIDISSTGTLDWGTQGTADTFLSRFAAAAVHFGKADAAAPVAQITGVQSVVALTNNTPGANWTFTGSAGTGTGVGGDIIFKVAKAGSNGSNQNAETEGFRIAAATALPQWPSSTTGAGTQTFLNSPCTGLTTEQWIPVQITGQTGPWYIAACQ
jgi:hypothetical protein